MATHRNCSSMRVGSFLFCVLLAASGSATSGSIARSNVPSDSSGQYLSCSNGSAPLVLVREKGATTLFQREKGRDAWRVQLPPMTGDRDEFILSPDGSAAVVTTNPRTGDAWLIGQGRKVAMPGANVLAADFQQHLALVVGSMFTGGRLTGFEFAVWDLRNMKRMQAHRTDDMLSVTVDRPFHARLTPDGTAYYYVAATHRAASAWSCVRQRPGGKSCCHDRRKRKGQSTTRWSGLTEACGWCLAASCISRIAVALNW